MSIISEDLYVEPFKEMVAYETLWEIMEKPTFKKVSERLQNNLPSVYAQFLSQNELEEVHKKLKNYDLSNINTLITGTSSYPKGLHSLEYSLPVVYYKGNIDLLEKKAISVVGSRKVSDTGLRIASDIASKLVDFKYAIVSGLARGVDTAAHKAAIKSGGDTIAVIGTPLHETYPKENRDLQKYIENKHLLLSQVPFLRYAINKKENWWVNKFFFPERNKTMAAITEATLIIEASDTSGTLIQARECLRMGKKLIIHRRILENRDITWPKSYVERDNVFVASSFEEILTILLDNHSDEMEENR